MCRRGKEHPFLRRQRPVSQLRVLSRVPQAQRKSRKKKLENQETPKKADLFALTAFIHRISGPSLARVQQREMGSTRRVSFLDLTRLH